MLRVGAALHIIVHRSILGGGTKDLAWPAIAAGVPTYLIDSEAAVPKRLLAGDATWG